MYSFKNYLYLSILVLVAAACSTETIGPQGPTGPAGPQGNPGESGIVFEFTGVTFTAPDYEVFLDYPTGFEGLDSDVALIYLLWDVQTDTNGNPLDIWRALPQNVLTPNGLLQYNFDFSKQDVHLFLDGDFNLSLLGAIDTDNWVVRVVVVPGNFFGGRSSVDLTDYYAVKEAYGLPDLETHTLVESRR